MVHEKDTKLVICNTVPIDRKYQHTLYFDSQADQEDYFDSKVDYEFDSLSYQRVGKNKIRVAILADKIYGDNYLYFKNFNSGSYTDEYNETHAANGKRFYAFIVGVEYINGNTSEITYEIDVMQTWHFNYDLGRCFVEREHVTDDTPGANTIPEPVDIGEPICRRIYSSSDTTALYNLDGEDVGMSAYCVVIATGYDEDHVPGGMYSGIPTGLNYIAFDIDSTAGMSDFTEYLQEAVDNEKDDAIVSIWMQPTCTIDFDSGYDYGTVYGIVCLDMPTTLDTYVPQNNKLLTYPYNYLVVDSGTEQATYKWERFRKRQWSNTSDSTDYGAFWLYATTCPTPEMWCVPIEYNNSYTLHTTSSNTMPENYTEGVVLRDFPQVAWASDAYRAWVASGGYATTFLNVMGGVGQIAAGNAAMNTGMTGIGISQVTSGLTAAAGAIQSAVTEANKGATGHGVQSASAMAGARVKDFYFKFMQLKTEQAKAIDNFLSMYGYQVNTIKVPNRSGRQYWNYVKTRNCKIIYATVPADDASKIESIYDAGITFWNPNTPLVGNYYATNEIVEE